MIYEYDICAGRIRYVCFANVNARYLICANKVLIILYRAAHLREGGIYHPRAHFGELIGGYGAGADGGEIDARVECSLHIRHAVADVEDVLERDACLFGEIEDAVGLGLVLFDLVGADDGVNVLVHARSSSGHQI